MENFDASLFTHSDASDALPLERYLLAPRATGCYVIGEKFNSADQIIRNDTKDAYLPVGFPDNFRPIYVGISESQKSGIRSRLSCHYRGRGNKTVKKYLAEGRKLYFIYFLGTYWAYQLESNLDCLRSTANLEHLQFEGNVRLEFTRAARRTRKTLPVIVQNNLPADYDPRTDYM
ncbi:MULTISPECIES: hypothetical protein [unclassified Pseudomonas]|uniref:hypothetical protein n=1 Tax=unclassified Pseudomonas TaxID=196821 RepID=UPI00111C1BBE|nr:MULTISPECIES: hypothetical protein [unclassified Pseudomonas]NKF28418.1 hypothetical protein [Pseudomonas sp. BG5]